MTPPAGKSWARATTGRGKASSASTSGSLVRISTVFGMMPKECHRSDAIGSRLHAGPPAEPAVMSDSRLALPFLNLGHALDHFFMLIFPTAVLALGPAMGRSYAELLPLATVGSVARGLGTLARKSGGWGQ